MSKQHCIDFLDRYFSLTATGTTIKRECLAGLINFMAMAYVFLVIPGILADAGIPYNAAVTATIIITAIGTLFMGLWANFPVAVAPGLGICAYFSYQICGSANYNWQTALGAVFISGCIFLLLTVTRIRQKIIKSVPSDLRHSIVVGIGLFIAFIGMKNCGLVVSNPSTFVSLGTFSNPATLLSIIGLCAITILIINKIHAALIIGIIAVSILGIITGVTKIPDGQLFNLSMNFPTDIFMALDIKGALSRGLIDIIISLTLVDLFDSMGVLFGLALKAGFIKPNGKVTNLDRALITDSLSTISGAVIGVPTLTAYIECSVGVTAGGRTGLTAVITGLLFAASLIFIPLLPLVETYATAPVLIIVGALMMQDVGKINFSKFEIALPTFLTIISMPLTFSIATGFGLGFLSWTILRILLGRWKEVNAIMLIVSICFAMNFALR